jgi:membrane associated rhomboid family serine protease
MGWQDRDYASDYPRGYGQAGGPRVHGRGPGWRSDGPSWLISGSVVTTLIVLNVVIFILGAISLAFGRFVFGFGAMVPAAVAHGQLWRLVTAQYLHAGFGHILLNMIALHFLGRPLEVRWSARRFFGIYTACGIFGNLFYAILGSQGWVNADTPAVGASGSIYGLLGIVAVMFPHATVYVYFLFPVKIRTAAIVLGLIAFLTVQTRGANYGGEACHLAGLVFGVWWAWRGDAWWSSTQWRLFPRSSKHSAGARDRVRPGFARSPVTTYAQRVEERRTDQQAIDRILKKVYEKGVHSLTESEKRTLQEATERQRQRDQQAGRMDRL